HPAEAAFARLVVEYGAAENVSGEIGPVFGKEHELSIGRLPQQIVRKPLLAAGADQEIGIGSPTRVEVVGKHGGRNVRGIDLAVLDLFRDDAGCPGDFLTAAIVERDDEL